MSEHLTREDRRRLAELTGRHDPRAVDTQLDALADEADDHEALFERSGRRDDIEDDEPDYGGALDHRDPEDYDDAAEARRALRRHNAELRRELDAEDAATHQQKGE